jgi:hypothetical protein
MNDLFIQSEWQSLCEHVHHCADSIAINEPARSTFQSEANEFASQTPPGRYTELLAKTADASRLAVRWQNASRHDADEQIVDEASEESFPASDPPEFTRAHA